MLKKEKSMSKRKRIMAISGIIGVFALVVLGLGYAYKTGHLKLKAAGTTYNVKNYGAKGDGVTNDTAAIQNTINAASNAGTGNIVYCPAGTYRVALVSSGNALTLKSNMTFQMDNAAEIRLDNAGNLTNYSVLDGNHIHDVNILGGIVTGDKYIHTGTTGEQGHGVNFYSCYNILIDGVKSQKCWGDGFNFDGNNVTEAYNFTIRNCISNDNRRQGLSIQCCNIATVTNNTFSNTKGTSPQGGIDLEPWNSAQTVTNVTITGNTMTGNVGGGMVAGGSAGRVTGNTISNNNISSNPGNGFWIDSCQNFTVTDNTINSNRGGMDLEGCTGWTVTGNHIENSGAESVVLTRGYNTSANSTGNHFSNNVITGSKVGGVTLMNSSTGNVISNNWIWNNTGSNIWEDSSSQGQNTISPNTFGPPSTTPKPTVTSITPNNGVNNASVSVTNLAGSNFVAGATVKLTMTGQSPITGTSVQFVSASKITCTLPLSGAATGTWNVVVTNPDNQSATLANGFSVTSVPPVLPAQVTGLHHTGNTVSSVSWDWDDISGATGYKVYRVSDNLQLADVAVSTWTQGSLSLNTQYGVYVTAYNTAGQGPASANSSAYTSANPPAGASHSGNSTVGITWSWQTNSNPAGTQFYASDSTGNSGWLANATSWNAASGHNINTQYQVSVKAKNGDGEETTAATTSAYTSANPPAGVSHIANTTTGITWSWNTNSNPVGTQFYASDATGNSGWLANATSWNASLGHSINTQYTVSVKAKNGNGEETSANTALAYTSIENVTGVNWGTITDTSIPLSGAGTLSNLSAGLSGIYFREQVTATNSGWLKTNAWTRGSLSPNTQYHFFITTRNGDGEAGTEQGSYDNYTLNSVTPPSQDNIKGKKSIILNVANQPAGTIKYRLNTWNIGSTAVSYVITDDLVDVLNHAQMVDTGGGTLSGTTLSYPSVTLQPYGTSKRNNVIKEFIIKLKPADAWPVGDTVMSDTYLGTTLNSNLAYKKIRTTSLSAFNLTQNISATSTTANPGDMITYTVTAQNQGNLPDNNYLMQTDIADILAYANVNNKGGGKVSGSTISWQVNIGPGSKVAKSFTVAVKPADVWPQGGALAMTSTYGTNTNSIELTPQTETDKIIASIKKTFGSTAGAAAGSIIYTLTLPGTIILLILIIGVIVVLVYFLIRYLRKNKK